MLSVSMRSKVPRSSAFKTHVKCLPPFREQPPQKAGPAHHGSGHEVSHSLAAAGSSPCRDGVQHLLLVVPVGMRANMTSLWWYGLVTACATHAEPAPELLLMQQSQAHQQG